MPTARDNRFFLYGYYGQGNLGDDLLLRAAIEGIRGISPDASFVVRNEGHVSGLDAYAGAVTLTGIDKILSDQTKPKWRRVYELLAAYRRRFQECRWFVFGGGTVFHERNSVVPLALLLATCLLARVTGLRVAALGVGVSELKSVLGRAMLNMIVRLSDLFAVRDDAALAECAKAGVANRVTLTGDLVFTLVPYLCGGYPVRSERASGRKLGLTVYPPALIEGEAGAAAFRAIQGALKSLIARGWQVSLLAFHGDAEKPGAKQDGAVLTKLMENLPPDQQASISLDVASADADECWRLFCQLDAVCGMRFHGLVLGAIYELPFVGISVDNKIDAICSLFGMPVLSPASLKDDVLAEIIERAASLHIDPSLRNSCVAGAERNFAEFARRLAPAGVKEAVANLQ